MVHGDAEGVKSGRRLAVKPHGGFMERMPRPTRGCPSWSLSPCRKATTCPGRVSAKARTSRLNLRDPNDRAWWRAMVLYVFATNWSGLEL